MPENRQLTVVFCDLVGSTSLAEQLDPEELRRLLVDFQTAVGEVVQRFDGHIAQFLGDGILVYFGYPQAHDDDARRAVQAGLGIVEAVARLNERLFRERGYDIHLRLGVHTGAVVTGEVGFGQKREILALGSAPNIAARIQSLADPDSLLLSDATYRLVQGYFLHEPIGMRSLKGLSRPILLYRVLGETSVGDRFDLALSRGLNPLVGRERELAGLWKAFDEVGEGHSRAVLIGGEPGLGKSRLVQAFKERVLARAVSYQVCRCSPYHVGSALFPIVGLLRELLRSPAEEPPESLAARLEELLRRLGFSLTESLPLFAALLEVSGGERYPLPVMTPRLRRRKTFEALLALLLALAGETPLVLAVEDLHWIDPSTLEFLDLLVSCEHDAPLLLLLTYRPAFKPPWAAASHLRRVELAGLNRAQIEILANSVAGEELPSEVLRQIVGKTDGVPLFVEELTKTVLESELLRRKNDRWELSGPFLPNLAIPDTLQGSLAARLDRLGATKEVVQHASVLGREFSYKMLKSVSPLGDTQLRFHLRRLVDAEMLYSRGGPPDATYVFKHALIQDMAYGSLLRKTRQGYHQDIAEALCEQFPEIAGGHFELVAHHYEAAGQPEPAIRYLLKAGRRAFERSALDEAQVHLGKGLTLLRELGAAPADRLELELRTALGPVLLAQRGYAAQEVADNYERALRICESLPGADDPLFWVLRGLWTFHVVRAELSKALELGQRLMELAERRDDDALLFEACLTVALPFFFRGEHAAALLHLERGIALDSPRRDRSLALVTGLDVAVTSLAISGVILWHQGHAERALERCREAVDMARRISHPFSLADALSSAVWLLQIRGDVDTLRERAQELLTLAQGNGFNLTAQAEIQLGWVEARSGAAEDGILLLRRGIEAYRSNGARVFQPYILSLLVEACLSSGDTGGATGALAEAFAAIEGTGEDFYWLPELYRLRGCLHLASESDGPRDAGKAEDSLTRALELARRQGSASLALRAATDLARLWRQRGKARPAHDLLSSALADLPEGSDTVDVQNARSELAKLC